MQLAEVIMFTLQISLFVSTRWCIFKKKYD